MKNKTIKLFALSLILLLSIFPLVAAQGNGVKFNPGITIAQHQLEQVRNRFEEKYQNFECEGECTYGENVRNQVMLQVREQRRFLFWDVNTEEDYVLNEEGEIIEAKYNFWSRVLNRKRLKVSE